MKNKSLKTSGIYGLIDPRTNCIRYVGRSKNIYKRYYSGHMYSNPQTGHPVSLWIDKLRKLGLKPGITILQKHKKPEDIEKYWIDEYREKGNKLLNIHGGGLHPSSTGNGQTTKIWSVNGLTTPWLFLCRSFFAFRKDSELIDSTLSNMKLDRNSRKTELDILNFELSCAYKLLNNYPKNSKQVLYVERWLVGVADKVNNKYPDLIQLIDVNGKRIA